LHHPSSLKKGLIDIHNSIQDIDRCQGEFRAPDLFAIDIAPIQYPTHLSKTHFRLQIVKDQQSKFELHDY